MGLVTWSESFSVGVDTVDEDHRDLFDLTNHVHEAVAEGQGDRAARQAIERLRLFAADHFRREEVLMIGTGYPGLPSHLAAHRALLKRVSALAEDPTERQASGLTVLGFLKTWLADHIVRHDLAFKSHLDYAGIARWR